MEDDAGGALMAISPSGLKAAGLSIYSVRALERRYDGLKQRLTAALEARQVAEYEHAKLEGLVQETARALARKRGKLEEQVEANAAAARIARAGRRG